MVPIINIGVFHEILASDGPNVQHLDYALEQVRQGNTGVLYSRSFRQAWGFMTFLSILIHPQISE